MNGGARAAGDGRVATDAPLPKWFWLVPVLAIAAWWPIAPMWQSDDFVAVHHVHDTARALRDFVAPQYGATDVWLFWRPLITASFWLEQRLGGAGPWLSHASNVVAHGVSALLVACVWRRFLPPGSAFLAALLWALLPSHLGSIAWAVGRVDSHTTVWCLLAIWLTLRRQEGRAPAWPAVVALVGAFASKELALAVPPIASLLWFARASGSSGERARAAWRGTRALWVVLLAYVPWRFAVLGSFGGYASSMYQPGPMLHGLATHLANLGVPLRWIGLPAHGALPAWTWLAAASVPVVGALLLAFVRAWRPCVVALGVFAIACAPLATFFAAAGNPQTLRLFYLPTVALAGVVAAAGRGPTIGVLVAIAWPLVAARAEQLVADRASATAHAAVLQAAVEGAGEPMFVAGLPRVHGRAGIVQLHFGVDRMLQPPFVASPRRLFALRPLVDTPGVFRLTPADEPVLALPFGSTWSLDGDRLVAADAAPPLPELRVVGDDHGVVDLTSARLDALTPPTAPPVLLRTPGVKPVAYRLTVFTATGYLATVFFDHGAAGDADGIVSMRRWLGRDETQPDELRREAARYGLGSADFAGVALPIPTSHDLDMTFPVLLEAGHVTADHRFVPTHRCQRALAFRFDRGYPAWVRRVQGVQ